MLKEKASRILGLSCDNCSDFELLDKAYAKKCNKINDKANKYRGTWKFLLVQGKLDRLNSAYETLRSDRNLTPLYTGNRMEDRTGYMYPTSSGYSNSDSYNSGSFNGMANLNRDERLNSEFPHGKSIYENESYSYDEHYHTGIRDKEKIKSLPKKYEASITSKSTLKRVEEDSLERYKTDLINAIKDCIIEIEDKKPTAMESSNRKKMRNVLTVLENKLDNSDKREAAKAFDIAKQSLLFLVDSFTVSEYDSGFMHIFYRKTIIPVKNKSMEQLIMLSDNNIIPQIIAKYRSDIEEEYKKILRLEGSFDYLEEIRTLYMIDDSDDDFFNGIMETVKLYGKIVAFKQLEIEARRIISGEAPSRRRYGIR